MPAQPVAVNEIEGKPAARPQQALRVAEQRRVLFRAVEIAEGISKDHHTVEPTLGEAALARIAFEERDAEIAGAGALTRQLDQVVRGVDAGDTAEAAP